jgi:DNA-directed RNA polymerase specialized sigma24 family protein
VAPQPSWTGPCPEVDVSAPVQGDGAGRAVEDGGEPDLQVVGGDSYPDWEAIYFDNVARVYRLMFSRVGNRADAEDLPESYRRILELRFLQGCSVQETATELGVSVGNARVLQHRALRRAAHIAEQVPS